MLGAMGHGNIELAQAADKADCFLWPFCRRNLRCGPRVEAAGPGHLSQGGSVRSTLALENLSPDHVCRVPYPGLLPASKNKVWRDRAASYFPDRAFRGPPSGGVTMRGPVDAAVVGRADGAALGPGALGCPL